MKPIKFIQANKVLQKPATMEDCEPLPVYSNGDYCLSLWRMSWRERFSALFFGRVWLFVLSGQTQPPVDVQVVKDVFVEHKATKK